MKKIIWIFGESATGKKTFIENVLANKFNLQNMFKLEGYKIMPLKSTIMTYNESKKESVSRNDSIFNGIEEFINSDKEILLIKGQTDDLDYEKDNLYKCGTLMNALNMFSSLEHQIILLEIPDYNNLYDRMTKKDWWLADLEANQNRFPRASWVNKTKEQRDKVLAFSKYGIDIQIVDTTSGYKKIEGDFCCGKSSNIRR